MRSVNENYYYQVHQDIYECRTLEGSLAEMKRFLRSDSGVIEVPLALRQQIWRRLQELGIPAWCAEDRTLRVSLTSPTQVLQVWSVVGQYRATRIQQLDWLASCWDMVVLDPRLD